jgi:hypothetical protein
MIYSTIPHYDVSVQASPRGVSCLMCSFGDMVETLFTAESTEEMIGHLEAHERKGDQIPPFIKQDLLNDDQTNYPQKQGGLPV